MNWTKSGLTKLVHLQEVNNMYREKRWRSDQYLDSFKDILERNSMHFLSMEISDEHKDTQEATDMVIKIEGGDVALRVREPSCSYRDLTIRSRSRWGHKTEIHKLKEGFGDWYLYGWGDGISTVKEYVLVDLHRIRNFKLFDRSWPEKSNGDGTQFISMPLGALEMCGCIISKQLKSDTQSLIDDYIKKKLKVG